jgi:hypothetical protein
MVDAVPAPIPDDARRVVNTLSYVCIHADGIEEIIGADGSCPLRARSSVEHVGGDRGGKWQCSESRRLAPQRFENF